MNLLSKKSILSVPLGVFLFLNSGCNTTRQELAQDPSFAWARNLQEQVKEVPLIESESTPILATPTAGSYLSKSWPWGSPQSLINPIKKSKPLKSLEATARARKTGDNPDNNRDSDRGSSVVVNVTQSSANETTLSNAPIEHVAHSRLEDLYRGQFKRAANRNLTQFGYSFFSDNKQMDPTVGPVPDSYVVGPGDEIALTLSDGLDAFHRLTVDRDGTLSIPEFGPVAVAGKRFAELNEYLYSFLRTQRHGFELTVSLGKLRNIRIKVVGRVKNPGVVEIPALGSALTALRAAGGPEKDGSLRSIALRSHNSNGQSSTTPIDLYEYLSGPDLLTKIVILRDGDTIQVPPIGPTVGIAGYVQQPGIYELSDSETTIKEAIELAGGLTPFSFTPLAHLERTVDGRGRQRIDIELTDSGMDQAMTDGELLLIEAVDDERQPVVRVEGEIARPGDYQHSAGMTLSDLIKRADGLTVNAFLPQVFISRQLGDGSMIEAIPDRSSHLQTRRILVADLSKALAKDPAHDKQLMPLDLITIRSTKNAQRQATVEIVGSVQRPGIYELTAGMRVSELVAIARNPTPEVYYDEAELIRKVYDETTRRLDVLRFRIDLGQALNEANASSSQSNPILANGDRLVIRSLQQAQLRVNINGQVRFPGEYFFPAGAKITDLIAAAGGALEDADLRASVFRRASTKRLQEQRMDHLTERTRRLYEKAFERMVQTGANREGVAAKIALQQTQNTLERMKWSEADGRIIIPFDTPNFPDSSYNLDLESGDSLTIPRYHRTISVAGDVFRPISLVAEESLTVKQALERAGGLTETADKSLLYIIRADGRVENLGTAKGRNRAKSPLLAGDVLLVPRKPIERTLRAEISDTLLLARQAAQVALIGSNIGKDVDMTFVNPASQSQINADANLLLDEIK